MKSLHTDSKLIDLLGGTGTVAALCDVKPPSVSEWRQKGIPKARLMFLRLAKPEVFQNGLGINAKSQRSARSHHESNSTPTD